MRMCLQQNLQKKKIQTIYSAKPLKADRMVFSIRMFHPVERKIAVTRADSHLLPSPGDAQMRAGPVGPNTS